MLYQTLKNHKDNYFYNNPPTARLINSAKNELGRIILEKLNNQVIIETRLMEKHWERNPLAPVNKIESFDVRDFYPSISELLLRNTIQFASTISQVSQKDKEIIFHSRKSLLFNNQTSLIEKVKLFCVAMRVYDGAEIS